MSQVSTGPSGGNSGDWSTLLGLAGDKDITIVTSISAMNRPIITTPQIFQRVGVEVFEWR